MSQSSLEPNSPDFAGQLMRRVFATYASCDSYMDEGQVLTLFINDDGSERHRSLRPFSTAFVRPFAFRFEFQDRFRENSEWNRYIVYQDGDSVSTWWSIQPEVETNPDLSRALAGATGVSGGSAITIPQLLMPDSIRCRGLLSITEWELLGEEMRGDTPTYKVHGTRPPFEGRDGKIRQVEETLWIDTQTLLILQTFDRHTFEDFKTETTTTYQPQINITVPPKKLRFGAPS